jgi:hypothetical protein
MLPLGLGHQLLVNAGLPVHCSWAARAGDRSNLLPYIPAIQVCRLLP